MTTSFLSSLYDPQIRFTHDVPGLGRFHLRAVHLPDDIALIHDWVNREYARFWGMSGDSADQVQAFYQAMYDSAHSQAYLGFFESQPAFLVECYQPEHDPIGAHYPVQPGDRGMHFLVAPAETRIHRFSWGVLSTVMHLMFSAADTRRVVVEPDVNNTKIHPLNRRVGFAYDRQITLPEKTAHLAFCTRSQFQVAERRELEDFTQEETTTPMETRPTTAQDTTRHLQPDLWAQANRLLVRKAIAEFAHELLLEPICLAQDGDWGHYELNVPDRGIRYRFRARIMQLDHWWVEAGSIEKRIDNLDAELDAQSFIIEFRDVLGIDDDTLPVYLEEISSTLFGSAYKLANQRHDAASLALADFQTIETAMTEGHPGFVANNGRIGFDGIDYHAYAPEAGAEIHLVWLAVHRNHAHFASIEGLSYAALLDEELGAATVNDFERQLVDRGLAPQDYLFMPIHPWQWHNKLAITFAGEVASQRIICLGAGEDGYRAQQSIRTLFNIHRPERRYVKTALSILNMGFMRGLSPYYMQGTPAINAWLKRLIDDDPFLAANGFTLLREVAAIGYRNAYFESAIERDSPYKKMLACLWRESPIALLQPGQRLMTMAALLHRDRDGKALLPALIAASGLDQRTWLKRYLEAYLTPLLHCFFAHDLVFMPHGENLILQLEGHVPVRVIMKDIAEESAIMNVDADLPDTVRRLAVDVPEHLKVLSIFTDTFDGIFRYLSHILVEHGGSDGMFGEQDFWQCVADCIIGYQRQHPQYRDKFARYDLFAPAFVRSCLNRLQLGNNRQMIDLADPSKNLKFAGTLNNPIAAFRPATTAPDQAIVQTTTA